MNRFSFNKTFNRIGLIGSVDGDSEDTRIQKSLLVVCTIPFIVAGALWGVMYFLFGENKAALIPLSYSIVSLLTLIYFSYSRKFNAFRFSQLLLILLLPFALMIALGGFVNGSVVIIWSLLSPLGALLFYKKKSAPGWLLAFTILVVISVYFKPTLNLENNLTPGQVNLFFVINLIAVGSLIFLMVFYFVGQKNYYQARSEALLLNILPKEIAEELKTNGSAAARQFDSVTVMFTDFKNFTNIAEKLGPTALVEQIDHYFKAFDRIISKYKLEKIKTIGDSYMCAGGLPVVNLSHPFDVVSAALEIKRFMEEEQLKAGRKGNEVYEIRIGIHTGPVVAGIVGEKKFAYDIWGDTVNIASRMESSGEAGRINISGTTYEMIKERFNCTYRGKIKAKNKGEVDMYFVEGNKAEGLDKQVSGIS
jgi:guanylate cyclase